MPIIYLKTVENRRRLKESEIMNQLTQLDSLIQALNYEDMMYKSLLALGLEKTDALVKNKPDLLPAIAAKEAEVTAQTGKLSKIREQLMERVAYELGEDAATLNLTRICMLITKEQSTRLSAVQTKLRKTVEDLSLRNQINRRLVESALEYVNFSIQLMAQPAAALPQYGRTGLDTSGSPVRSLINIRS